jgi:hypothetical protein
MPRRATACSVTMWMSPCCGIWWSGTG